METAFLNRLTEFRRELHRHPELSGKEVDTQRRILSLLMTLGITKVRKVGGTGLMCEFDSGKEGPVVLIRGDIDALPIREINTFEHKSINEGVSHKCGHDGHTSILCGLAGLLIKNPSQKGKVLLLFQPAEENGEGAKAVLEDPDFDQEPDWIFALHNLPGYPLHTVVCREGAFTPTVRSIVIKLSGKTSHAAEPELGVNPAKAVARIIAMFEDCSIPDPNDPEFSLSAPVYLTMGSKDYGISAGYAEVHYTIRTWDVPAMAAYSHRITSELEAIALSENLEVEIEWLAEFFTNSNHADAVGFIKSAAETLELEYIDRPHPFKWGEDFGLFTSRYRGAMFGIGSGESCPALHNPDYDFPDEILETGAKMFETIIRKVVDE